MKTESNAMIFRNPAAIKRNGFKRILHFEDDKYL